MKTIKASEFKAKCLKLMDEVAGSGEELVITKNGKAITKLVAYRTPVVTLFGAHRGRIHPTGDIVGPLEEPWNAAS